MRLRYIVSIDTDTGEAVAAEISADQANRVVVAPSDPRAAECYGRGNAVEAAADVLARIMPEGC